MAKSGSIALLLLAALLASSCVIPALQPFYSADTLAFDQALIGTWSNPEGEETYTFGDNSAGGYILFVAMPDGNNAVFSCHLFSLAGKQFLDMVPDLGEEGVPGYAPWHFAPLHTVYMVEQIRPTLRIQTLNPDWLLPYLEAHPDEVAFGNIDLPNENQLPVFTATTAELQAFLAMHVNAPDAFYAPMDLVPAESLLTLQSGVGMGKPQQ